jgi:imidazolonepropionase-like amidohydrolase
MNIGWRLTRLVPLLLALTASGQVPRVDDVTPFVSVNAPVFVLNHVRVVDGTGAVAKEDHAVIVAGGNIQSIGPAASLQLPHGAQLLDRTGYTVIPGLVGMHNHLYYNSSYSLQVGASGELGEPGFVIDALPYSAPRLYLAAGVTTMRTTGSIEPYSDLKVKQRIDGNLMPGPSIDVTAPYLEGPPTRYASMHELTDAEDARRLVDYWAAEGATSFKAYMNITRDELAAAIQQAHLHKLKLTGHLCSVTWHEAIALGIDDLEHGPVFADTDFVAGKKRDVCPQPPVRDGSWANLDINGPQVQELIHDLVRTT